MHLLRASCQLISFFILSFNSRGESQILSEFQPRSDSKDVVSRWMNSIEKLYQQEPDLLKRLPTQPVIYEEATETHMPKRKRILKKRIKSKKIFPIGRMEDSGDGKKSPIGRTEDNGLRIRKDEKKKKRSRKTKAKHEIEKRTRKPVDIIVHIKMKDK